MHRRDTFRYRATMYALENAVMTVYFMPYAVLFALFLWGLCRG